MFWSVLVKANKVSVTMSDQHRSWQSICKTISFRLAAAVSGAAPVSAHLQWNCSSFLIKRIKQRYGTEPDNLKACNSFCYNRLILRKMVVESPAHDKVVVIVTNQKSASQSRVPPMCRPSLTRTHLPEQHPAQNLQEQVLPKSVCRQLSQGQHHGTQPEVRDIEEEADPPHQKLLSTTHPLK